jgi:lysophospholipase L1-like esterase
MRPIHCVVVGSWLLLASAFHGSALAGPTYRIMPLGDSITDGAGGTNAGYRGPLYGLLTAAGYSFQFVGSAADNPGTLPSTPLDQRRHEGHSGYVIAAGSSGRDGLTDNLNAWLGAGGADPNVILLMIGTNDINLNYQRSTAPQRLDSLVSMISNKNTGLKPNAHLIIAQIVPIVDATEDGWVREYNLGIADVVFKHRNLLGENVSLVDMHSSLVASDFADMLHPNNSGYNKMAGIWMSGIAAVVPEPSTVVALLVGLIGLLGYAWRRRACS